MIFQCIIYSLNIFVCFWFRFSLMIFFRVFPSKEETRNDEFELLNKMFAQDFGITLLNIVNHSLFIIQLQIYSNIASFSHNISFKSFYWLLLTEKSYNSKHFLYMYLICLNKKWKFDVKSILHEISFNSIPMF